MERRACLDKLESVSMRSSGSRTRCLADIRHILIVAAGRTLRAILSSSAATTLPGRHDRNEQRVVTIRRKNDQIRHGMARHRSDAIVEVGRLDDQRRKDR